MTAPIVQVKSVTKKYGSVTALNSVSFEITEPQIVGLLGPNGAGKTTLLKILTNISKPTAGSAMIGGKNVSDDPLNALRDVGSLVEQPEFYPYLKGFEVLSFTAVIKGLSGVERENEIRRVAEITGCSSFLNRKVSGYSRGMKQRLGLASALIGDPDILILDEPTFGLDPLGMVEIRKIIRGIGISRKKTIIMSTHLVHEAQEVCDRVIIVNGGSIIFDGPVRDGQSLKIVASAIPDPARLKSISTGTVAVSGNTISTTLADGFSVNDLLRELMELGVQILRVSDENSLEDLYVKLISADA
ncbi:MAG: ABC transporter ATP-binding protein [Thermoplasmataceae archaeon]